MAQEGRWDPLKELTAVQQRMNRLFESAMGAADFDAVEQPHTWSPVSDVHETAESLVVYMELPGLEQQRIDVRVEGDELVVSGERVAEREQPGEVFHRVERPHGKFLRRFRLPSTVDRDAIQASFQNGALSITLPNRGERTPQPIQVEIQ